MDWYKPLEKHQDELTTMDVYYDMSEEKRHCMRRLMWHAAKHTLPNGNEGPYLAKVFETFTENEKLTTYYFCNEAILKGKDAMGYLDVLEILHAEKRRETR